VDEFELERERLREFEALLVQGRRAASDERWKESITAYEAALLLFDNDPQVLRGLGHARFRSLTGAGCPERAIEDLLLLEVYDPRNLWLRERVDVLRWMEQCGDRYEAERLRIALEIAALPPEDSGRPASIDVEAASLLWTKAARLEGVSRDNMYGRIRELLERQTRTDKKTKVPTSAQTLYLRGELARVTGENRAALEAFGQLLSEYPSDPRAEALGRVVEELEIQRSIAALAKSRGGRPTPEADAAYESGRSATARGDFDAAERELRMAVDASPWFPRAQYELGQLLARRGRLAEAIEHLRLATVMEPTDYHAHMALALVCFKEFKGARDELAKKHFGVALRLRPDLYQLHFYLGELMSREVGSEDREAAQAHFRRFIAEAPPEDPMLDSAREALRDLQRSLIAPGPMEAAPVPPRAELERLDPDLQRRIDEAYVVGAEYGDWRRAQGLLLDARASHPGVPALLNELAKVSLALGDEQRAQTYWEESLTQDGDQPEVHERLAIVAGEGDAADAHWSIAARQGSLRARYQLARRAFDGLRLLEASNHLELYRRAASPYELDWEQAQALSERTRTRLRSVAAVLMTLLLAVLAWGGGLLYRRYRGDSLAVVLEAAPKAVPEVARILSLIRHEVLKHNTSFLVDVGEDLARGSDDAAVRATTLFRRLFEGGGEEMGPDGDPASAHDMERRGIYGRFLGYCQDLEAVARTHGRRLNLRRRDPVFGPMLSAFRRVKRRARDVRAPKTLTVAARKRLGHQLALDGAVLGREASEQLARMVERRCLVEVDGELLRSIFEEVVQEQQFVGLDARLVVGGLDIARVRIFRSDLEDILSNVLRNSLASSRKYGQGPLEVGISLTRELDEITALETLAISLMDRSPEPLTNEMLRGRYADRGMGITADLLSRYDGSIAVESRETWSKAVVIRFFCVEATDD
jgi:tetratricopeptide (TPR) repeat protein